MREDAPRVRAQLLRVVEPRSTGDRGQTEQQIGEGVAGYAWLTKFKNPRDCTSRYAD